MSSISVQGMSLPMPIVSSSKKKISEASQNATPASTVFSNTITKKPKPSPFKVLKAIFFQIIHARNTSVVNSVLGEARAVYGLVKTFFKHAIHVARIFAATELSKFFSLPFELHDFVLNAYDFCVEKGQARIDAFLGIVGSISEIGDIVSSLAAALVDVGAFGMSTMLWATPLNLASCVLSAVFIVMNIRSLYFSSQVVKHLDQKIKKPAVPDYHGAYKVFKKHTYELGSHCGVNVQLVQDKIRAVYKAKKQASTKATGNKEFESRMETIFKGLKRRIHCKQFSLSLGMLNTKLGMLATFTFALSPFFAPLAVVGFCALAILFANLLFKMGFDFYANARLKHTIKAVPAA